MAFCAKCGAQMTEGTTFCGSCGAAVEGAPVAGAAPVAAPGSAPAAASSGLDPKVAGALAYFTIIPPIIFLVADPYKNDRTIRFHSFQSLFLAAATFVIFFVVGFFAIIPFIGWVVGLILFPLLGLSIFGLVIFCMYKAYNGEQFLLPVIGKLAQEQAAK